MRQGEFQEASISQELHSKHTPFLISPLSLRSLGLGQIDVAYYLKKEKKVGLVEVKKASQPSAFQRRRLLKTQEYLSKVLNVETFLAVKFCQKDDHSLFF